LTIRFFYDEVCFNLKKKRNIVSWLKKVASIENKTIDNLCYVFVSNEKILDMNKTYLQHDYFTDIITFDYSYADKISGEMYISIDTVEENAKEYSIDFRSELLRVILHGALHLCGYKDETEDEQIKMREIEDGYLKIYDSENETVRQVK